MSMQDKSDQVRQFTVGADDDGVRLDRWFKRHLPQVGFATVSRWARTGQIRVDGKRAGVDDRLTKGQVLRVPPGGTIPEKGGARPRRELTEEQIEKAEAMVLTQDRAAIVLNKPPGLATQGGSGTKEHVDGLLDAFAADGPRPRLVHRLDKDTSGVLLIARTPGSAAYFSKRFSTRTARKIYWALIVGVPSIEDGMIELPLAKQPGTGGEKMMVDESEQGQPARTRYRVIDRAGNRAAWVELQPFTGRTHQLRVHMAAIGHPIVGDGKYGGPDAFLSGTISRKMHLHARRLIIDHPDGAPLDVTAPLPEHFAMGMEQLGFDEDDGEMLIEAPRKPSREVEKTAAKAHAKQYRKERRGERQTRKSGERGPAGSGRDATKPPSKPAGKKKIGGRPSARSGAGDGPGSGAKSAPKTAPGRTAPARPTGRSIGKPKGRRP
ncbi:RluA family pseudouridine synthase [Novosphingobium sp. JCM 18896]|uniref:RluA family pseudouridine synthase n=1 Tax=Novosphingobium sp. JCM 18896 TaxID=2989731 RepID=UPI002223C63C|nr:RluA family pseudouridine synthase [Novosphingobium sp. JCM 18896]MCW1427737.1 RluA family pseudouridine synthase [Novosphingobium sp. JCM 18896]